MAVTYATLTLPGYRSENVPNTFLRQTSGSDHLAIQFPGFAYSAGMPVLYYPGLVMLDLGADLLRVEYAYHRQPEFTRGGRDQQAEWLRADASAALEAGLSQRPYRKITLMGKSIGTRILGQLCTDPRLEAARLIWLTPLFNDEDLFEQMRASQQCGLFVSGSKDDYYNASRLNELGRKPCSRALTIQNADHSLEIAGNTLANLDAMRELVEAVAEFAG